MALEQKQVSLSEFMSQVITQSPISPPGQRFLLMYHSTVSNMTALLPVGAYNTEEDAKKDRDELNKRFGFNDKYSSVIAPLGQWGSVDEGADIKKVLEASFYEIRRAQQERKLGYQGVTPEVQAILERIRDTPNLPPPAPPGTETLSTAEPPVCQKPNQQVRGCDAIATDASPSMPAAAQSPQLPTGSETPPSSDAKADDCWHTAEESARQVQSALDALSVDQAKAMLMLLQNKLKAAEPKTTPSSEPPVYKPGQQDAFNQLTPKQKAELRRRLMKARRTNNQSEIDAICKKFGPIVVVDTPELKDHVPAENVGK
jgi:hypothetical protein